MKIIKQGRDPKFGQTFTTTCRHCETVFEWHTSEANLIPDSRDGDYYALRCPVCKNTCTKQKPTGEQP